ncbi:MAG: Gfo/Idh/MocA family protein [Eubacteriales bacterium]|jgi:predicted dehydrogenase
MMEKCRIGVVGLQRGMAYAQNARLVDGLEVTAVCDFVKPYVDRAVSALGDGVKGFTDYDEFLDSGLFDTVVLCNFFHEHAPLAIKAMERGIDVLSETTPAITMQECADLCRAVERTGRKYMLAENYPFFVTNLEMKRLYETGKLGRVLYAEGEYVHPSRSEELNWLAPGLRHWRNWIPRTYYLTHSLAPLMYMTGERLVAVNAKTVQAPELYRGTARRHADAASIMMVETDSGAVFRITGCAAWAGHGNTYRLCCTKGSVENIRGTNELFLHYNSWAMPEGESEYQRYTPSWPSNAELAAKAGHGGGDFWVMYHFGQYMLHDIEPFFDVYNSVAMSAVAILAQRSALEGGKEYRIPDFRSEEERKICDGDTASPMPDENLNVTLPISPFDYTPAEKDIENAKADWKRMGVVEYN